MAVGPLKTVPIFKERVWGGDRLARVCNKRLPAGQRIGESWELSVREGDTNRVAEGEHAGRGLDEVFEEHGAECFGEHLDHRSRFPLLVKFLDARDRLSVQVHPDDRQAARLGETDSGKWEAWVVLDADPGARLYKGFRDGVTRKDFAAAIESGRPDSCLEQLEARVGDVIGLPPGTPHAIGSGYVLAEIQQSSDLTYRVHDWGRVGLDGKPRELHLERALEVLDFETHTPGRVEPALRAEAGFRYETLISSPFFGIERMRLSETITWPRPQGTFEVLVVIDGAGRLRLEDRTTELCLGDTVFLPARGRSELRVEVEGPLTILRSFPVIQEPNR